MSLPAHAATRAALRERSWLAAVGMAPAVRAGGARVAVPALTLMLVVQARLVVVAAGAAESRRAVRRVTLVAVGPTIGVLVFRAAVDREADRRVHIVGRTERCGGRPRGLCVAGRAGVAQI